MNLVAQFSANDNGYDAAFAILETQVMEESFGLEANWLCQL